MSETIIMVETLEDMLAITGQYLEDEFPPAKAVTYGKFTTGPGPSSMNRGDIAAALNALMKVNETADFKRGLEAAAIACRLVKQ
jgi:hypothetical protein